MDPSPGLNNEKKTAVKMDGFSRLGKEHAEGSAAVTDTTCGRRSRRVGVAAAEGAREGGGG